MFTILSVYCSEKCFPLSASSVLFSLVVLSCSRTRCVFSVCSLKFKCSETSFLKELVTKTDFYYRENHNPEDLNEELIIAYNLFKSCDWSLLHLDSS